MNVLITAASRRVPLVQAFRAALGALGWPGRILVTDVNPMSPAVHFADRAYRVPLATDPTYLAELFAICEAEGVSLVVPTIDDELPMFGAARPEFEAIGAIAACSPEATASVCNDKFGTCRHLATFGVPVARTFLPAMLTPDVVPPLFIKPRMGRGAVQAFPVRSRHELDFFLNYVTDPVIQEYLDGPEYTIDVLCDFAGRPLSIVPRERVLIRAGVIDRGRTVRIPALFDIAQRACGALAFVGPLNIQCRMRGSQPVIIEINPRFSGGIPLTIASGADFPKMLLQLARGAHLAPAVGQYRDDLWMTNYESSVFLDATSVRVSLRDRAARVSEVA